jgi:acetyl-CoA carboxylase beta subunit
MSFILWILTKIFKVQQEDLPIAVKKTLWRMNWIVGDNIWHRCIFCGHNRFRTVIKHQLFKCRNCQHIKGVI